MGVISQQSQVCTRTFVAALALVLAWVRARVVGVAGKGVWEGQGPMCISKRGGGDPNPDPKVTVAFTLIPPGNRYL